jgi:hypothetical protein
MSKYRHLWHRFCHVGKCQAASFTATAGNAGTGFTCESPPLLLSHCSLTARKQGKLRVPTSQHFLSLYDQILILSIVREPRLTPSANQTVERRLRSRRLSRRLIQSDYRSRSRLIRGSDRFSAWLGMTGNRFTCPISFVSTMPVGTPDFFVQIAVSRGKELGQRFFL